MIKNTNTLPSQEYLIECFRYDLVSGELFWKARPLSHFPSQRICNATNEKFSTKKAGCIQNRGNTCWVGVKLSQGTYRAHRIIFKLMTGRDPIYIDHIDRNPLNNQWTNIRECTSSQNAQNTCRSVGVSGLKGAFQSGKKWKSYIQYQGKNIFLGRFTSAEMAHLAYKEAAQRLHGEFVCLESK